jgi:hypothetical protein
MPVTAALIGGGASLLGGFLGGSSQKKAAQISANAQLESARIAADAARFRPVGVTTRFGQSQFQFDPRGNLESAGYQIDPRLAAYQDRLQALSEQRLGEAEMAGEAYAPLRQAGQQLFQLGGQYMAETPEQVAERYMARQMDLLAPSRERQYAQLQNQLFQTGRGGLAVGGTGMRPGGGAGLGAANPEMEAYYNALAQQDAQLAAQAQQAGQQQVAFGTGLFGQGAGLLGGYESGVTGALNPFTTTLGGVSTLESLGMQPLDIGAQLGGRSAQAGANVGQSLLQGGISAARTMQAASAYDPMSAALMGLGSNPALGQAVGQVYDWTKGLFGGGSAPASALPYASQQGIGGAGGVPYMLPSIWSQ